MQPEQRQQKTPTTTDEPALARKMNEIFATPQKPQLVSVGVQSPDFMMQKTDKDKGMIRLDVFKFENLFQRHQQRLQH